MILTWNDVIFGLLGGSIIGLACALMWLGLGRIAGISGILSGIFTKDNNPKSWRIAFILGLIIGGSLFSLLISPTIIDQHNTSNILLTIIAGLCVGFGSVLGSGCTSGHGVCGLARLSKRSLVAVTIFILSGILTVTLLRLLQ